MTPQQIRLKIKEILHRNLQIESDQANIPDDFDFFTSGQALDSVESLELTIAIEQAFGITLIGDDTTLETLSSLPRLVDHVMLRLRNAAG